MHDFHKVNYSYNAMFPLKKKYFQHLLCSDNSTCKSLNLQTRNFKNRRNNNSLNSIETGLLYSQVPSLTLNLNLPRRREVLFPNLYFESGFNINVIYINSFYLPSFKKMSLLKI